MDPITTTISVILSKIVLDKFYEGVSSKLGEKVVEKALAPIEALGKLLWNRCFKGKPETKQLLDKAELNDAQAIETLKSYLAKALENPQLKAEVERIVQQIHQTIVQMDDVNAKNAQQIFGGTGQQFNNENIDAPVQQGTITNHNYYGTKPN
ncbi:MAG: globin [Alkalinema sp. CAN_BIN05]|nr:globin [Alkalinema sp. CAN_BIN05]